MDYGSRTPSTTSSSIVDGLTLSPLPYPVLLILALIFLLLGISWYSSFEETVEEAEWQINWLLLATPVLLIIIVRWLSSMESYEWFFGYTPYYHRTRAYLAPSEGGGGSPWGVAAVIVLLLVLVQYQSSFLDSWFI